MTSQPNSPTKPYEDLLGEVLPYVPGCPETLAVEKLRTAAIDLCRSAGVWQHTMERIDVKDGEPTYALSYPPDSIPERIVAAWFYDDTDDDTKGRPLAPASTLDLERLYKDTNWETREGTPNYYTHLTSPLYVRLVPIPVEDDPRGLEVRLQVTPSLNSTAIPEWLYERYWQALAEQARAELMKMPDQQWTDFKQAGFEHNQYRKHRTTAQYDRSSGFTGAPLKMRAKYPLA